ncbi:hypothetical protein CHU92_05575 [Flavobacterium cyanobacteriorum]|uniref:Uncharacterized protein n=1 Tax=Flavobacterium cyanobacteriorum TaxID=2022802 RepID=A0A255Z9R2_9FLAO|nr:hypothetical protein CHU92_05575 [Flavobacterium cyanobacteriorum]
MSVDCIRKSFEDANFGKMYIFLAAIPQNYARHPPPLKRKVAPFIFHIHLYDPANMKKPC